VTLVQNKRTGAYVEVRPSCCSNGHPWTKGAFTASSEGGHGDRIWTCNTCGDQIRAKV
jgi:hypothetical protein